MTVFLDRSDDSEAEPAFGSGGTEPYARALRRSGAVLYLREHRASPQPNGDAGSDSAPMHVSRWNADADAVDRSLLEGARGPVLDVGCGPGRMVRAAVDAGLSSLGLDVSPTAVQIATESGLSVLNQSVFEELPPEAAWGTILLVDGNIGIGGDPTVLLRRCEELLAPGGAVIIEVSDDRELDRTFDCTVVDSRGEQSAPFPWAEIGSTALESRAGGVGLRVDQTWGRGGRTFCRLERRAA
ncbi:class I SAM-dependent methyltransferase [Planctomonas psychrotolerans]|uniref:class I SAM-dependent methyltransferase n=1 Tax=Planctomonas psychrotolerans TaxID=2528712 RepID=UPI0012389C68|nr:class I SAM-dependent methyltransferase [Planctomonas psychrotolerans]